MQRSSSRQRRWLILATAVAIGVIPVAGPLPAGAANASAEVAPAVRQQLAHGGSTPFWVFLRGSPGLPARSTAGAVHRQLTQRATSTQAGLRELLTERKATFEAFWIADAIRVVGDSALLRDIAARPEVAHIEPEPAALSVTPPKATADDVPPPVAGVEWNLHRIGADQAWNVGGSQGEGIVVANIDSGVLGDHPALAGTYRGRFSTGTADDGYNWFDPTGLCPGPCDDDGHGTHVMGLEAGRAADGNPQMGVAPGARWIAANKGSEVSDRVRAAQWMLAPTDANGENPRPDLAPDVVNISWYFGNGGEDLFRPVLDAWVAAGIFPVVAAGNNGGSSGACSTNTWPASFDSAFAVANTTPEDAVAPSSSRGPTADGRIKPDIAAPGTSIRSAYIGPEFNVLDGTSMAAPQVAGAVALLWSAVPALDGDVAATRKLLGDTAHDINDTTCGGTAGKNNVAGEGLLDIAAALRAAPKGTVGSLTGTAGPDARIQLSGPKPKNLSADGSGRFELARMVPGKYTYRATAFGYQDATGEVTVPGGGTATLPIDMRPVPRATVSGVVRSSEGPVTGATVTVDSTPVRVRTGSDGRYQLRLPTGGGYRLTVESPSRCALPVNQTVTVTADTTLDVGLPARTDLNGADYVCTRPAVGYQAGTTKLALSGAGGAVAQVSLPFPVKVFGTSSTTAWISTNGALSVTGPIPPPFFDVLPQLPDSSLPVGAVLPFYSVLDVDGAAGIYTSTSADQVVVEWRDVQVLRPLNRTPEGRISVSLVMRPDGTFTVNYRTQSGSWYVRGHNALIGLQNGDGSNAFVYGDLERVVADGSGFTIRPAAK
ncbi:S8 family serine peptidase [Actinoplanes sp. NPDC049265]|uniref:S8 family serine peptidase n=1 Tax=Actinoplanes sp. NPDC049265 TaxID=3363902 RepID=UPI003712DD1D